jgi:hypothetical protein
MTSITLRIEDEENGYSYDEEFVLTKELSLDLDTLEVEFGYPCGPEEYEELAYQRATEVVAQFPTCFRENHTVIQVECNGFNSVFGEPDGSYWEIH